MSPPMDRPQFSSRTFGHMADGTEVVAYSLRLPNGVEVEVIAYGAILTAIRTPDREHRLENIVLGFDHLEPYLLDTHYIGAVVGRVANRIAHGRCLLNGRSLQLSVNHPPHHLHGGFAGLHNRLWVLDPFIAEESVGVTCQTSLPDGEDGYPGDLDVNVTYILKPPATLVVRYAAISRADTLFNPTQHTYFNLDAERGTILDHDLMIRSDAFLETDESLIPSGRLIEVDGTRLDFNASRSLRGLSQPGQSIDHSWVLLSREQGEVIASLSSARNGRRVDVITDAPTIHVYAGHGLQADAPTSNRQPIMPFSGICLETQGYADAPNHPEFPSILLPAGRVWTSETIFRFSVDTPTPDR